MTSTTFHWLAHKSITARQVTQLALWLATLLMLAPGCTSAGFNRVHGSGNVVTQSFDCVDFDALHIGNAFHVRVIQGQEYGVEVQADDNVMEIVEVIQKGTTLQIGLLRKHMVTRATLNATVTMPEVANLVASGASRIEFASPIASNELSVEISGASRLTGNVETGQLRLSLSGASRAELDGTSDSCFVNASGASRVQLDELVSKTMTVDVSGASSAIVYANRTLAASASGASKVGYSGDPTIKKSETSGASSISPL